MIRLIKVEAGENNNKYYNMEDLGDGTFNANYGRVGSSRGQNKVYSMGDWDKIYRQKIKKGYKDITEISAVGKSGGGVDAGKAQAIIDFLMNAANASVSDNYLVSSDSVTEKQVDEAQEKLNKIASLLKAKKAVTPTVEEINENLTNLYTVIPRRMGKVIDHMAKDIQTATEILTLEQANLDVMRGQVAQPVSVEGQTTLSDFNIEVVPVDQKELNTYILPRLSYLSQSFKRAWRVSNLETSEEYDHNLVNMKKAGRSEKQMLLWHGSRNENWWSIIRQGLVLRPTNAVITGKMFGYGTYFADYDRKSYGYTSGTGSYWAGGNSNKAILALYEVHVGNQLTLRQHDYWMSQLTEEKLKKKGNYDSVFAEKGYSLMNNEYIVYRENQCTIRYLVEVES